MSKQSELKKAFKKYFPYLVVILACWIIFGRGCRCNPSPYDKPEVKTVKEQVEVLRIDSIASALFRDSVNKIVSYWQSKSKHWEGNWNKEVIDHAKTQTEFGDLLNESVPDTCEQYKQKALAQYNKLVKANFEKDNACAQTINAKNNIINQKDVLINRASEDFKKLRSNIDTCFAQQTKLEKYIKKIQPKNEIGVSVAAITDYTKIKLQLGAGLYFRTKKGFIIEVDYYTNNAISLSFKRPLVRF